MWLPSRLLAELCRFRGCPGGLGTGSSPTKVEKGIQGGVRASAGPGSHVAIVPANADPLGLFYRLPRSLGAAVSTPLSALSFQSRLVDSTAELALKILLNAVALLFGISWAFIG